MEKYNIQMMDYITNDNTFMDRIICGCCGGVYGRKVWNSNHERLKRIIWQCNGKYKVKGKIECRNRHINDGDLYQAFVYAFNAVLESREHFISKWKEQIGSEDILKRVTARRFITIFKNAEPLEQFDIELYFKLVEKITVYEDSRLIVSLLDGSEIECGIE